MLTRNEIIGLMFKTKVKIYLTILQNNLDLHDHWHEAAEKVRQLKVQLEAAREVNAAQAETIAALKRVIGE